MNLRTSLIGAINLITTFITIAIAITTPVFANKNIFNHMALTNIKIETNINGENKHLLDYQKKGRPLVVIAGSYS